MKATENIKSWMPYFNKFRGDPQEIYKLAKCKIKGCQNYKWVEPNADPVYISDDRMSAYLTIYASPTCCRSHLAQYAMENSIAY